MLATLKYASRYLILPVLALFLIPLRLYMLGNVPQNSKSPTNQVLSPFRSGSAMYGITMLSPDDIWAVGGSFSAKIIVKDNTQQFPVPINGIILHYTNHSWMVANTAEALQLPLLSVSLDSPRDGWAVGWDGTFVHYNGNQWSTMAGPENFKSTLLSIVMRSSSDGWAVGYSGSILHYDGRRWTQIPSPTQVDLRSIAMPTAREGWAVGDSGTLLHYFRGAWTIAGHSPTNQTLNSVSMLSTSEGWAVGERGTILHFRDGEWVSVHPLDYYQNPKMYESVNLQGVAMSSIRSGWIISDSRLLVYSSETWIEANTIPDLAPGGKSIALSFNNLSLYSIIAASSDEKWIVGRINNYPYDDTGIILHYQAGRWSVFSIPDLR